MGAEQKEPWVRLGKQEGEQYAKAKVQLDKKHAALSKTASTLGPKKLASVQAKATAKAVLVSKAKVMPTPKLGLAAKATPAVGTVKPDGLAAPAKVKPLAPPKLIMATPSPGKISFVATVQEVPAPMKPLGVVAKATRPTTSRKPAAAAKKTVAKKTVTKVRASDYLSLCLTVCLLQLTRTTMHA